MSARRSMRIAARLLGRHVARIAERHAEARRRGLRVALDELREAEVEQLDEVRLAAPHREVDVARAQVAVDVADRVRLHQRLADLDQDVGDALDRELLLAREHAVERLALEQLHREVEPAVGRAAEVVDLDDVLVVDLGDRRRFAAEPLDREVVARQLVVEDLDRDLAAQRHVLGAVDRAGAALTDALQKEIPLAEHLADERVAGLGGAGGAAHRAEERFRGHLGAAALADGSIDRGHLQTIARLFAPCLSCARGTSPAARR